MSVVVTQLWIYPVKSCAGIRRQTATVTASGLEHDREWMFVDDDGVFLSQRKHPMLTAVQTKVDSGVLSLSAPGLQDLDVDPKPGAVVPVSLWGADNVGVDEGPQAAEWISDYLHSSARLVRRSPDHPRLIKEPYLSDAFSPQTSFADGFASLLTSAASLRDVSEKLGSALPMDRFRPNIVVDGDGLEPWEEDYWRSVRAGVAPLHVLKPCDRCPIPDTDQQTGERSTVVRGVLGKHRRGRDRTKPDARPGIFFGQNIAHGGPFPHTLSVGDPVIIEERAMEPNIEWPAPASL